MKTLRNAAFAAAVFSLVALGTAPIAAAQEDEPLSRAEISVLGGIHALNENDTALPDHIFNVPLVAAVAYHVTSILAAEGEFTWIIPVEQSVDLTTGGSQDLRTPHILAYQANARANLPVGSSVTPYLVAGVGAVTFLSNTDSDRLPRLDESQTAFAINFGTGFTYALTPNWGLRADARAFVAFPQDDAVGLAVDGTADEIWMERGTVGAVYRF